MTPEAAPADATLLQAYARALAEAGPGVSVVALHIGAEQTGVASGMGPQPERVEWLALGTAHTARRYFKRTPPTPLEMETAIQDVEERVMPLHRWIPRGAQLFSTDGGVREIAALCGLAAQDTLLSLEAMERCFNRLAAVVEGSGYAQQGLPASNALAATLLILREFMHHLHFTQIALSHEH